MHFRSQYCPEILSSSVEQKIEGTRWHKPFFITRKLCIYLTTLQENLNEGLAWWAVGDQYKCLSCDNKVDISKLGPDAQPS